MQIKLGMRGRITLVLAIVMSSLVGFGMRAQWRPLGQSLQQYWEGNAATKNSVPIVATAPMLSLLTVTNLNDSGDGSLRSAIANAANGDTITFADGLTGTITLTSGELNLDKNLTINGPGANRITISGNQQSRIFYAYQSGYKNVASGVVCTINGLTIANGSGGQGGAIWISPAQLTMNDCIIKDSTGHTGGGIYAADTSTLTMNNCQVIGNTATGYRGGGIFLYFASLRLNNCTIANNSAPSGGGIGIQQGNGNIWVSFVPVVSLENSTISGNQAVSGAGIDQSGGELTAANCTISGNVAHNNAVTSGASGGAIDVSLYEVLLKDRFINCTIVNNSAAYKGGGISILDSIRAEEYVQCQNTIIANNTAPSGGADIYGRIVSLGHNLIGNTSNTFGLASSDLTNINPQIAPLANSGGKTATHALLPNSPALNAGDDTISATLNYDQRGFSRKFASAVDIGATEGYFPIVTNLNDSGSGSLRDALQQIHFDGPITFAADLTGTIELTSGALLLNKSLSIVGPGADLLTISGNHASRVLQVGYDSSQPTVSLSNLTIASGNAADDTGGGISNTGILTMENCVIRDTQDGGAFYNQGTATLTRSVIKNNNGGGIIQVAGSITLNRSTIAGNSADASGTGGGIRIINGALWAQNSTIAGNFAGLGGGAILNNGQLSLMNCTVAHNRAETVAGTGIVNSGVTPGTLLLQNTIVANNVPLLSAEGDISGEILSQGNNLIGNSANATGFAASDLRNVNALLEPLGDYGGNIETILPLQGSPAINAGSDTVTASPYDLTTDQRGVARNLDGAVDMGAVEAVVKFTPATLPTGKVGAAYSQACAANSNGTPLGITIGAGVWPAGLAWGGHNFAGTPTTAGTYELVFYAATADGMIGEGYYRFVIESSPPVFYGIAGRTIERGIAATSMNIGSVSDGETAAASLQITVTNVPTGISVTNIVNTNGTITADVAADCTAQLGNNTVTLSIRDGNGEVTTGTTIFDVVSTASLGDYGAAVVATGGAITIAGSNVPEKITSLSASAPGFTGAFQANLSTGELLITNAGPAGNYLVTVQGTAACSTISKTFALNVSSNHAPVITSAATLTRVQNAAASITTLATIRDEETAAANLNVTATTIPTGILLTNLTNNNGVITANLAATCNAALGANTLRLSISDGEAATIATVKINVTAGASGTLGNYAGSSVTLSNAATIVPDAAPIGGSAPVTISAPTFTGTISVHPTTGVISVTNAGPLGSHVIAVQLAGVCTMTRKTFALTVTGSACDGLNFSAASGAPYAVGTGAYHTAAGDLNGDNKPDLVVSNFGSDSVSVLLNNGSGGFGTKTDYVVGDQPTATFISDFNRDGKKDFVVVNGNSSSVSVFLGRGDGTFNAKTDYATGAAFSVTVADVNNDGKADIITNSFLNNTVSVLLGNGSGSFAAPLESAAGASPYTVTTGDFNNDGNTDLVVSSLTANSFNLLLGNGNGNGTFAAPVEYVIGVSFRNLVVADLNQDGSDDVALASGTNNSVSVLLNNGNGTLGNKTDYATNAGASPNSVAVGDFNGDGKRDLVSSNRAANQVSIFPGNGDGTFAAKTNFAVGTAPYHVMVADFNGDGKADLATANFNGNNASVLLNSCTSIVTQTPAPVLTPAALTRQQGVTAANASIATISGEAPFTISAVNVPTGITITNIINTNGNLTAHVNADCKAALGNNVIELQAIDKTGATATANIAVNVVAAAALQITTAPTATTVTAGQLATFTVAANNSTSVQWQVSMNGGQFWTDVRGASATTLSFTALPAQSGSRYRAVFTNCNGTATTTAAALTVTTGVDANTLGVVINEFRLRGNSTQPELDEYIEIANNTNNSITVNAQDGTGGWAVATLSADGNSLTLLSTIPNGTVLPAKSRYLLVNSSANGYSLNAVASGDAGFTTDLADDAGIALFATTNTNNCNAATVIDAVGFQTTGTLSDLFREGIGLPVLGTANGEYAWVRRMENGQAIDTNDNVNDFLLVSPDGATFNNSVSTIGAPGPENSMSPREWNGGIFGALFDPLLATSIAPNQVRDTTPLINGTFGTLALRRTFTNNTGVPLKKLRFRVIDISNAATGTEADLRLLGSVTASINGHIVEGLTLEQPPIQTQGGGVNATLLVGAITPTQPLAINGAVSVEFKLGVMRKGRYRFFLNIEAAP